MSKIEDKEPWVFIGGRRWTKSDLRSEADQLYKSQAFSELFGVSLSKAISVIQLEELSKLVYLIETTLATPDENFNCVLDNIHNEQLDFNEKVLKLLERSKK